MKKFFLLLIITLNFQYSFSKDSFQMEVFENTAYTEATFSKILEQEKRLYNETKNFEHLLNVKYIEAATYRNKSDETNAIPKFLWIIEHARTKDFKIKTYSLHYISSLLSYLGSHDLALKYSHQAVKNCEKYKITSLIASSYSNYGLIHYKLKNYDKAAKHFQKAIKTDPSNNLLFKASLLNNISLCKLKVNDLSASNLYINKSLSTISKIKEQSFYVREFKVIVEGNLGSNYFMQKRYQLAKPLLEQEIDFYKKNNVAFTDAKNPLDQLLKIYLQEKNSKKVNETIQTIKEQERISSNKIVSNSFTEILYDYYREINDNSNFKIYSNKLIHNTVLIKDSIEKNLNKINAGFYDQQINSLKNQFKSNNKLLNSSIKAKKNTNIFLFVLFILISVIFSGVFIGKSRRERRNKLISNQKQLLDEKKRIILENEIKLKQEKITSLALNLNLKKETEKAFLEKIKEIKRKRNIDIESVLRDLQHSVNNLLQIDNKNIINSQESDAENLKFIDLLKNKHPNLSEQELTLCSYFRMNLNSKEIASLTNLVSGTIRVKKTKIKTKIGLEPDQILNEYLVSLTES